MKDFGLTEMTGAEQFWYVLMCIAFGIGYWAKIPVAKALSELPQFRSQQQAQLGTLSQVPGATPMPPNFPTPHNAPSSTPPTPLDLSANTPEGPDSPPVESASSAETPPGQ